MLFLILVIGCVKQELIKSVQNPEQVYERVSTILGQRVDSIDNLHCLGELHFTGGWKFFITLNYSSRGGVFEIFSPLRQSLGWVHFDPDTMTYSFEDSLGFSNFREYGLLLGWALVGHPSFPSDPQALKIWESRRSYYIQMRSGDLLYYLKILKEPILVQWMKIRKKKSVVEVNFKNYRKKDNYYFPYLLTGSTPLGDFELRYLEVRFSSLSSP